MIISKIIYKFKENNIVIETLLNTNYTVSKINKKIANKFGNNEKKQKLINIESVKTIYQKSTENDETLRELLIWLRDDEISKEFKINEKCILSNIMIGEFLNSKPIDKEDFITKIDFKFRDNIEYEQMKFIDAIFEIIEMTEE